MQNGKRFSSITSEPPVKRVKGLKNFTVFMLMNIKTLIKFGVLNDFKLNDIIAQLNTEIIGLYIYLYYHSESRRMELYDKSGKNMAEF